MVKTTDAVENTIEKKAGREEKYSEESAETQNEQEKRTGKADERTRTP